MNIDKTYTLNNVEIYFIEYHPSMLCFTAYVYSHTLNWSFFIICKRYLWNHHIDNHSMIDCALTYKKTFKGKMAYVVSSIILIKSYIDTIDVIENDVYRNISHINTKISWLESVVNIEDIIHLANKYHIKNISVTDINSVQNYVKLYRLSKKHNLKFLPGIELSIVDDTWPIVEFKSNIDFDQLVFIVIDLETNGLNPYEDHILEIGYIVAKNGHIIEAKSILINVNVDVKPSVAELTGISNQVLSRHGISEDEAFNKLYDLFQRYKDALIVSYSDFDIGFLQQWFIRWNIKWIYKDRYIDAYILVKNILVDKKKNFNLESICRYFQIETWIVHRALEDAWNTYKVLRSIWSLLKQKGVHNIDQLNIKFKWWIDVGRSYKIILYAIDKKGLYNIYRLCSLAKIKYFFFWPKLPLSILYKYRTGLIWMSMLIDGEFINLCKKGLLKDNLNRLYKYHYIELIPEYSILQYLNYNWKWLTKIDENIFSNISLKSIFKVLLWDNKIIDKIVINNHITHLKKKEMNAINVIKYYKHNLKGSNWTYLLWFISNKELIKSMQIFKTMVKIDELYKMLYRLNDLWKNIDDKHFIISEKWCFPKIKDSKIWLTNLSLQRLNKFFYGHAPKFAYDWLYEELRLINDDVSVLFLIAKDVIDFSYKHNWIFGSWGSIGCSFIAFLLNITQINPLPVYVFCKYCFHYRLIDKIWICFDVIEWYDCICKWKLRAEGVNLMFNIFLGLHGEWNPDIDINFNPQFQKEVIKFLYERFNKDTDVFKSKVIWSGTTLRLKYKFSLFIVNKFLQHLKSNSLKLNIDVFWLASKIYNVKIGEGQHPGGILFIPDDVLNYTPINWKVEWNEYIYSTHLDYHFLDHVLLKLDILGQDNPSMLEYLLKHSNLKFHNVDINDAKIYDLFVSNWHLNYRVKNAIFKVGFLGIPEFSASFSRSITSLLKPKNFSDLVYISGITHGKNLWSNNGYNLIKQGRWLDELITNWDDIFFVLSSKYHVPIQDAFEVMEIVRKGQHQLSSTLLDKITKIFNDYKVPKWYQDSCYKVTYLFPKAHAIAYTFLALKILYFKLHYPKLFYISLLNRYIHIINYHTLYMSIYKLEQLVQIKSNRYTLASIQEQYINEIILEIYYRDFQISKIDLYHSWSYQFYLKDGKIIPPFGIIKGLGIKTIDKIINARNTYSWFISYRDFVHKTKCTNATIDILIKYKILKFKKTIQKSFF